MGWFKAKKSSPAVPATQIVPRSGWQVGWEWNRCAPLAGGEQRLYGTLRESVPIISATLEKAVRLVGTFQVERPDTTAPWGLTEFLRHVPVGAAQAGIQSFLCTYLDQLLMYGTAVGEIFLSADACRITGLYNTRLEHPELRRGEDPLKVQLRVRGQSGEAVSVKRPNLVLMSALSPEPGEVRGASILRGLPFLGEVLMKIYYTIGTNQDHVGSIRFAMTYKPSGEGDRAYGAERARRIADQRSRAMQPGAGVSDFAAVGNVSTRVIGADNQILDSEIPVRQLSEQIVAKLGVSPFLLGLPWSSTERMSSQQADLLTSELKSYRHLLESVVEKTCRMWLLLNRYSKRVEIIQGDISLQDTVDLAGTRIENAQATKLKWEVQEGKEGRA